MWNALNVPIDNFGNTLLHLAVVHQDKVLTNVLLQKGADPNIVNKSGVNPIMIAQRIKYTELARNLEKYGASTSREESPTTELQMSDHYAKVNLPIFNDPNSDLMKEQALKDQFKYHLESKMFSLCNAAYLGLKDQLLPALNPDVMDQKDDKGCTMLMKAAFRGHMDLVKSLVELGANLEAVDSKGHSALIWAILGKKDLIAKYLVDRNASLEGIPLPASANERPLITMTPLIAACYVGSQELVEYLVEKGANVDNRAGHGQGKSALMVSAWMRNRSLVLLLLQKGAFVDPDVNFWLNAGIIRIKKTIIDQNPWASFHEGSTLKSGHLSLSNGSSAPRRMSLQDKLSYCSAGDIEIINEISGILSKRAGMHGNSTDGQKTPEQAQRKTSMQMTRGSLLRKKNNNLFRQGINLEKVIGSNSSQIMKLAEHMPEKGTELDVLWINVFQCVLQLVMAANKNIKHHYIAISAKANHEAAEIIRALEMNEKHISNTIIANSPIRNVMKDLSNLITVEYPKKLMLATRMAIGVWPPPDAVANMIKEAAGLASTCKDFVQLANTLGSFPVLEKTLEISVDCINFSSNHLKKP